ncbi:MAG: hypothetical protein AAFY76_00690 [Cyanobacteria bacterium J06649_11]
MLVRGTKSLIFLQRHNNAVRASTPYPSGTSSMNGYLPPGDAPLTLVAHGGTTPFATTEGTSATQWLPKTALTHRRTASLTTKNVPVA